MRKLIVSYSGVAQADMEQAALSISGVNDALRINVVPALIVDVAPGEEAAVKSQLQTLSGVSEVTEDDQFVPMVADKEYLRDFISGAEELRGYSLPIAGDADTVDDLEFGIEDGGSARGDTGPIESVDDSLEYLGVNALHDRGFDGDGVIMANLDTGVMPSQFEDSRRLEGWGAGDLDPWNDHDGHGSYTMGICAGGEQTEGIERGPAYNADIYPLHTTFDRSQLIAAADHLNTLAQQVDRPLIVNHSWGNLSCDAGCDNTYSKAFREAASQPNAYHIFAAGNEAIRCGQSCTSGNATGIATVGALENVITAAAAGRNGNPETMQPYSSRGPGACFEDKPDVTAPIYGTVPWLDGSRNIGNGGGTSGATPQIAGSIALAVSATGSAQEKVFGVTRGTASQFLDAGGFNYCSGHGMFDAEATMNASQGFYLDIDIPPAAQDAAVAGAGIVGPFAFSELRRYL